MTTGGFESTSNTGKGHKTMINPSVLVN